MGKKFEAEAEEMKRMLKQTQGEEQVVMQNITKLEKEEKAIPNMALVSKTPTVTKVAAPAAKPAANNEAMQKLMDENNRLKHEKAELERQLSIRKVAKEKEKLK